MSAWIVNVAKLILEGKNRGFGLFFTASMSSFTGNVFLRVWARFNFRNFIQLRVLTKIKPTIKYFKSIKKRSLSRVRPFAF